MFSFHGVLEVEKNKSMFSESRDVGSEKQNQRWQSLHSF